MRATEGALRPMAIAIWLCSMMLSLSIQACITCGMMVDELSGPDGTGPADSVNITFSTKGAMTLHAEVPYPSIALSTDLDINGGPAPVCGTFPLSPRLDIGGDGTDDWAFDGIGYGEMGHQTILSDGKGSFSMSVNSPTIKEPAVLLPSGSRVLAANITIRTEPTDPGNSSHDHGIVRLEPAMLTEMTLDVPDDDIEGVSAHVVLKNISREVERPDFSFTTGTQSSTTLNSNYLVAQSFLPQTFNDGAWKTYLSSLVFKIGLNVTPTMGDIKASVCNTSGAPDYTPTADCFGWGNKSYADFSFLGIQLIVLDHAVPLEPGKVICVVLRSPGTVGGAWQGYLVNLFGPATGDNSVSPATTAGTWAHTAPFFGSWAPWLSKDVGMTSYNLIREPITSPDVLNISMCGAANGSLEELDLLFPVGGPAYVDGYWPFNISNNVPYPISFKLTANTTYLRWPRNVKLDVGSDGVLEWDRQRPHGDFSLDITASIGGALLNSPAPVPDSYGIRMTRVGLGLEANNMGTVVLGMMNILYEYKAPVPDFKPVLRAYLKAHDEGIGSVSVPLVLSSDTAGVLHLSGLNISLDLPPRPTSRSCRYTIPEEGSNGSLVDLHGHFEDEHIDGTTFELVKGANLTSGPLRQARVEVLAERWVSVDVSYLTNVTGSFDFTITAVDALGQEGDSVVFVVDVGPVNDPPVFTSIPPKYVEAREQYVYNVVSTDSDDDDASIYLTMVKGPKGMTIQGRDLRWTPSDSDMGTAEVTIMASDGKSNATQSFSIIVSPSGAPMIKHIEDRMMALGEELILRVTATSLDGNLLYFGLDSAPQEMTIDISTGLLTWTPRELGNYSIIVNVTDLDRWTLEGFTISVVPPGTNGTGGGGGDHNGTNTTGPEDGIPGISLKYPAASGETLSGIVRVTGDAWVENGTLLVVRCQLDNATPENATGLGEWVYLIDTEPLDDGPHLLKFTAFTTNGRTNSTELSFFVKNGAGSKGRGRTPGLPGSFLGIDILWFLGIMVLLISLAIAAGYSSSSRSSKGKRKRIEMAKNRTSSRRKGTVKEDEEKEVTEDIPVSEREPGDDEKKKPRDIGAVPVAAASTHTKADGASGTVVGAFLIYHDGRLLGYHMAREVKAMDDVLKAAKEEVKRMFQSDGKVPIGPGRVPVPKRDDMDIVLERGIQMYSVILIDKDLKDGRLPDVRAGARSFMHDVHERYRKPLKNWKGDYESIPDIGIMTKRFLEGLERD